MRDIANYTDNYQIDNFELNFKVPYRRKHVLQMLQNYPHDCILEIGCGMESILYSVNSFKKGIIVEPSELFAKRAETLPKVTIIQACLEECLGILQKEHFDFIVLSALLHEVENPVDFLCKVHSLCDNNTIVHINVPNANSFHRLLGVKSAICDNIHTLSAENLRMQQNTVFDVGSLESVIHTAATIDGKQVHICSTGSFFVKPFTNKQMGQCLEYGIITSDILEGLDRMIEFMPDLGSEIYANYRVQE